MDSPFDSDDADDDPLEPFDLETTEPSVPSPDDPTPSPPEPSTPSGDGTVDPALKTLFWKLVLLYKASLLGTTLGALLVVFDVSVRHGAPLLVGSLVLLGYTLYLTKRGQERAEAGEFDVDPEADENGRGEADENSRVEADENSRGESHREVEPEANGDARDVAREEDS